MPAQQRKKTADAVAPEPDPEEGTEAPQVKPEADPAEKTQEKGKHSLLNPGNTTITYTADGKQLDPGVSVEVDELDDVAEAAIERGYLIEN
jgi:hypothetical protein